MKYCSKCGFGYIPEYECCPKCAYVLNSYNLYNISVYNDTDYLLCYTIGERFGSSIEKRSAELLNFDIDTTVKFTFIFNDHNPTNVEYHRMIYLCDDHKIDLHVSFDNGQIIIEYTK